MTIGHCRSVRRAAGDVGLLRDRFRDHLGFLVSHDKAPFRGGSPSLRRHRPPDPAAGCISAGETFSPDRGWSHGGETNRKRANKKRISPRMVQAGNANRRDNPYDRKIRPMQTYPAQADGLSVYGNFGVFACTDICLKIQLILQTVKVSVILPLSLTS